MELRHFKTQSFDHDLGNGVGWASVHCSCGEVFTYTKGTPGFVLVVANNLWLIHLEEVAIRGVYAAKTASSDRVPDPSVEGSKKDDATLLSAIAKFCGGDWRVTAWSPGRIVLEESRHPLRP